MVELDEPCALFASSIFSESNAEEIFLKGVISITEVSGLVSYNSNPLRCGFRVLKRLESGGLR